MMSKNKNQDSNKVCNKGYTLIELMLVMSVIAVLTLSSYALFTGTKNNNQLTSEAKKIVSNLKYIKLLAVNEGKTCRLKFNSEGTSYDIRFAGDSSILKAVTLDYGIKLDSSSSIGLMDNSGEKYVDFIAYKGTADSYDDIKIVLSNEGSASIEINITSEGLIDIK